MYYKKAFHMNKTPYILMLLMVTTVMTTNCSNIRNSMGLEKEAPDEFAVITRAPLEIPAHTILPPPTPGKQRPQEQTAIQSAQNAILGDNDTAAISSQSEGERALLQKTGAQNAATDIRQTLDQESDDIAKRERSVFKRLLGVADKNQKNAASVVDSKKEHERLQQNKIKGRDITYGETPTIID